MKPRAEIKNAKITSVSLGYEDHGILTCFLYLDYGGASQGFGGYTFDEPADNHERRGHAFGTDYIIRVLKTVGVQTWEDLPGKSVRVDCEHSRVHGIGHYLEDKWFYPEELAAVYEAKEEQDESNLEI